MNTERIKEIQQATAYPESVSVQQALLQVWNETEQEQLGIAAVSSRFNFGQEVWFLNGRHVMSGKVEAIRGQKHYLYEHTDIELEVCLTSGKMGCKFWVKDEDCFETRQALVDSVLNGC
jgi:hypothetical protein